MKKRLVCFRWLSIFLFCLILAGCLNLKEREKFLIDGYRESQASADGWVLLSIQIKKSGVIREAWKDFKTGFLKYLHVRVDRHKSYTELARWSYEHLIYVGPWQYEPAIGKEVRVVATQAFREQDETGGILTFFESKDEQNVVYPEQPLKLVRPVGSESHFEYARVKWYAENGYQGIGEEKKGFWGLF